MHNRRLVPLFVLCLGFLGSCGDDDLDSALGRVQVAPLSIDFGPVWVGDRVEETLRFENDGRVPATLPALGLEAPFDGPESVQVPSAGGVTVAVGFRPVAAGAVEREVRFASEDHELAVILRGEGVVAELELAEQLDFGSVRMGERAELELPVGNGAPLGIADFRSGISGEDAEAFSLVRDIRQIEATSTATFAIAYTPTLRGPQRAVLSVAACATCLEKRVILRGRGIDQELVATPPTLDFGPVPPGRSRTLAVEIRNRGEAVAALREARVEGEAFSATAPALPIDLATDAGFSVEVAFAPTEVADRTGVLSLVDASGTVALTVPLRGHGGGAELVADPPAVDFGRVPVGWNWAIDVIVRNLGEDVPVEVVGATIEGGSAWSLTAPPLPAAVEEEGLPLRVGFSAGAVGPEGGVLVLATSNPGQPEVRVPLAALVVDDPGCVIVADPEELRFGLVRTGTIYRREVRLVNAGTDPCIVWDVHLDPAGAPEFELYEPPADGELGPGETLAIAVTYSPLVPATATQTGLLRYRTSNLAAPTGEVPVSGFAPGFTIWAEPEPLDFGTVPVNRAPRLPVRIRSTSYPAPRILAVALSPDGDPNFGLVSVPQLPVEATPTGVELVLDFLPPLGGLYRGTLEVKVEGSPEPLLVRLRGEGDDGPCGTECDPPVPECPPPGDGLVNQGVTLQGGGVDPNGDPVTCEWSTVLAPPGSAAQPSPRDACLTTFIPDLVGDFVLRLRVRDPLGNVGECTTTYKAHAPTAGLWVEMFWDLPNDVDLHLLHPAGGPPGSASGWRSSPYACYYANMNPEWDLPGTADNPSLDRDDTTNVGPENIRIDAPTANQDYHVGLVFFRPRSPGPTWATTNVYCGGVRMASEQTQLTTASELFWVGTVRFDEYGYCRWTYAGQHPTP